MHSIGCCHKIVTRLLIAIAFILIINHAMEEPSSANKDIIVALCLFVTYSIAVLYFSANNNRIAKAVADIYRVHRLFRYSSTLIRGWCKTAGTVIIQLNNSSSLSRLQDLKAIPTYL